MAEDNPRETACTAVLNVEAQHARVVEVLEELDRLRGIAGQATDTDTDTDTDLDEPMWDLVEKYAGLTGLSAVAKVESRRIIKDGVRRRMTV